MATHKFKKTILSLKDGDTFTVPDGSGGTKVLKLTPERLKKWAGTFQQMKSAGINVPAPWRHQKEMTPVVMGHEGEGAVADAAQNAGFWTEMKYDPRAKALVGVVEVPGDRNDPNTPAGKMGTLVKETSIFTAPSWTDGRGRKWEDAIMHVGCVTYPIEPGQDNFELVEGEQVICMSFQEKPKKKPEEAPGGGTETDPAGETEVLDPESGTVSGDPEDVDKGLAEPESVPVGGGEIGNVIGMLESAGIVLPSSTTPNNFLAYLEIALGQFLACNEGEEEEMDGTYNTPPEGAKEKNAPVIMSFSDPQIKAILASKAVNPDTNKPFTEDELRGAVAPKIDDNVIMSHPLVTKLANTVDSVTSVLNEQARSGYRQRAGRLVNAKVIAALGPTGILINISRGSVVDQAALVRALEEKKIAAAGLDVFEVEPCVPEGLADMPDNVVLQPHQASATHETRGAMGDLMIANVQAFLAGKPLLSRVN